MEQPDQARAESEMLWVPAVALARASAEDHAAIERDALDALGVHLGAAQVSLWQLDPAVPPAGELSSWFVPDAPETAWPDRFEVSSDVVAAIRNGRGYAEFDLASIADETPDDPPDAVLAVASVEAESHLGVVAISQGDRWNAAPEPAMRGIASLLRHSRRRVAAERELSDRRRADALLREVADVCLRATLTTAADAALEVCRLLGEFLDAEGVVIRRLKSGQAIVDTKWISDRCPGSGPPDGHSVPYDPPPLPGDGDHFIITAAQSPNPIYRSEMDRNWGGAVDAYVQLIHVRERGVDTLSINHRSPLPRHASDAIQGVATQLGFLQGRIEAEQYAEVAFADAPVGIVLRDRAGLILRSNAVFSQLVGPAASGQLIGERLGELLEREDHGRDFDSLTEGEFVAGFRTPGTESRWGLFETVEVTTAGRDRTWLTYVKDITDQRRAEEALLHDATHDELTGLQNRRSLKRVLAQSADVSVVLVDLDRFKLVNDSLGHDAGDDLLRLVADRLRLAVRPGDQVFRHGGDEFAVVVAGPADEADATRVAMRLLALLNQPVRLGPHLAQSGASIGVALAGVGVDSAELLRRADTALYRAKELGGSSIVTFDEELGRERRHRLATESGLRSALNDDRIVAHYQPEVSLVDGSLLGAEALARWDHPTQGLLPGADFIPIAEEIGLVSAIGEQVLRDACAEAAGWPDRSLAIRVNLSASQLLNESTVAIVRNALRASGLEPERLCLEVTESAAVKDAKRSELVMRGLKSLGIDLALDDFGTGYSSLGHLQRLPIDSLKIDRSVIRDLADSDDRAAFVKSIISLAKSLGISVVAEGVETEAQADVLRTLGCTRAQGFLFGHPMPARELMVRMS